MEIRQGLFRFVWHRCPDGYEIIDATMPKVGDAFYIEGDELIEPGKLIRPKSDKLDNYFPGKSATDIHVKLSEIEPSPKGMSEFISEFGLLNGSILIPATQMNLDTAIELRQSIIKIQNASSNGQDDIAKLFGKLFRPDSTHFWLAMDPKISKLPIFNIVPSNLANFIVLNCATELSGGIEWRKCANPTCENTFRIAVGKGAISKKGVSTTRRKTCGDRCRKAIQLRKGKADNGLNI
jgi:hypothetical protein